MKTYEAVVTFLEPRETVTHVKANSEEEAHDLVTKLISNRANPVVVYVREAGSEEEFGYADPSSDDEPVTIN